MKFPYREIEIAASPASKKRIVILRPVIPVMLIYNRTIVGYQALIDSGADYNVFDGGVAQVLGIRLTSGHKRQIAGIGGSKIKGYEHRVVLRVGDSQYSAKVIFSKEIPQHSFGVLGNQGFFDQFNVNFNYRKKFIEVV